MSNFMIEAEYAHTVIGRRAQIPLGAGKIPVVIQAATLDPDQNTVVVSASIPGAVIPLRFAHSDLLEIEHETEED